MRPVTAFDLATLGQRRLTLLAAASCLVGAIYLGSGWRDERRLQDAKAAARAGDHRRAIEEARKITRAPTHVRALVVEGQAALELGDATAATRVFRRAAEAAPNDFEIRRAWAAALLSDGRRDQAERQFARAAALNPLIARDRRILP